MVADTLKLLPRESETSRRWSAESWARDRRGWLFLTSTPETRTRLVPLTSLWLDMLVLRLMNRGQPGHRPVWFVLDELASLQRLPQLHTAVTENRKSNNPVVLGFQGRSQLETRYGHDAEAMLSQPATKIFLRTSEPHAAKWISEGQHPITGDQLVRHQTARETKNARGDTVTTMEHRAGWDATFSAPKSVSLTALVGGDARVRDAHRESVRVALRELELYTQARLGGNRRPETTGNAVMALFEHDSARPVHGYAAPQLHTHAVIFNLTQTADGTVRPLQPRELYRSQQYATAVYRSELAARLTDLGYEMERGRSGQPEIRGLHARVPRRVQPASPADRGIPGRSGSTGRCGGADCGAPAAAARPWVSKLAITRASNAWTQSPMRSRSEPMTTGRSATTRGACRASRCIAKRSAPLPPATACR
jgi:hypothetical protein